MAGLAIIRTVRFAVELRNPHRKQPGNGQNTGTETIRHGDPFFLSTTPTLLSFES
jgi:hypothetical protein